ncbi:pentatricopeptide repeat-containing family protein [Striga asiatica]|uniref:Pentatricopeptide repeat-containing family protein n=1 Tax=Striga asiatica TaxID=4170 RepID=A0A5A7PAE8_STRAF|nr:pentatricopeptide repeat-containing family protein [Striga asiatica]
MQALAVWTSPTESLSSFVLPRLHLNLCPSSSSVKLGHRRRRLGFSCSSYHGLVYVSSYYFRSFEIGAFLVGKHSKLKSKFVCFSTPKTFALSWALEEPAVGDSITTSHGELVDLNDFPDDSDDVKFTHTDLDDNCHKDTDVPKNGLDHGGEVENDKSEKVDVRALSFSLHSAKTADDVEFVLKGKEKLPLQVFSTIIKCLGKERRVDAAMALFLWLKRKSEEANNPIQLNLFIYNNILGTRKHAENLDFVEEILSDMSAEGLHPNVVTYNTLMSIHIDRGQEAKAIEIFHEMPAKGVSHAPASYSTVIFAYRRMEDGFGALSFFVEIRNKYQKGEIGKDREQFDWGHEFEKLENFTARVCYQVMRCWLVRAENLSTDVLRFLIEMDNAGLRPGQSENERLIWACTREEHYLVAKELYARIREMGNEISLSVCNHVIWILGKAKKWWAALEVYEDMLDKGPKPNYMSYELIVSHFNILLSAARKKGIWRWGVRLLNKMEEKGLKPGSREWNSVLVACSKASETSAAVEIFKRMVENGEKPTIISYGALLSALEKGQLYEEAFRVWDHMIKVGVEPNLYAYTIMASIYAAQGKFDILDSIVREMTTVGVGPTVVTFNAIISSCGRNNFGGVAYEWFEHMKARNVDPNEVTYEMLIEALARDGKPRIAYELHLKAQNEGLVLSAKAYDAIVRSSEIYGATVDLRKLGPRPTEKKKKLVVNVRREFTEFCRLADVPRRSNVFKRSEICNTSQIEEESD